MLLEGLHIPLTTPFHPDGRLNSPKLIANIARYSKTPAAGLIVLGPAAEPTLLSDDETREVLRTAAKAAAPEKVLIAGISRDSVHATLDLAKYAAEQNYDAVLIGLPSVLTSEINPHEILTYFRTIADHSPLPLILLSTPARPISIDISIELAAHPHIIGLLETAAQPSAFEAILQRTASVKREVTVTPIFAAVTARMLNAAATTASRATLVSAASLTGTATAITELPLAPTLPRTRTKTVGFQLLAGATGNMLDALQSGATAIAPAFAACAPQACYEVFAAWKDSDQPLAAEKQLRLREAAHLVEDILGSGGLKHGCDLNGYYGGLPRLPHLPPTGEQRTALERLMEGMRN
jgi:4-hydroxy-2-oxoglutarate aldolase